MDERTFQILRSKICGSVQEVILPDFPTDDNTAVTNVTKSRRVSFGTNFIKEFVVDSAVSAQCVSEYEQALLSSDSSNANSSYSGIESGPLDQSTFEENHKEHQAASPVNVIPPEPAGNRPKIPKYASTICFSADSPTADMEFTEGCITLAKSILDKKDKEMTVIIQAKPKEPKERIKQVDDETKYLDGSQFDMSMTKCLKSKENKREEKRFESDKTKIFNKYDDEMSITRCDKVFKMKQSQILSEDEDNFKENHIPLDMIMRHLDKDDSDLEKLLFNPAKCFNDVLNFSNESEKLNLDESMDISREIQSDLFRTSQDQPPPLDLKLNRKTEPEKLPDDYGKQVSNCNEEITSQESMDISKEIQLNLRTSQDQPPLLDLKLNKKAEPEKVPVFNTSDDFGKQVSNCNEEITSQESVDISKEIQSDLRTSQDQPPPLDLKLNKKAEPEKVPVFNTSDDFGKQVSSCNEEITSQESMDISKEIQSDLLGTSQDQPPPLDLKLNKKAEPEKLPDDFGKQVLNCNEEISSQEAMDISKEIQSDLLGTSQDQPPPLDLKLNKKAEPENVPVFNTSDDFGKQVSSCNKEITSQESMNLSREIQSDLRASQDQPPPLDLKLDKKAEPENVPVFNTSDDFGRQVSSCNEEITSQESVDISKEIQSDLRTSQDQPPPLDLKLNKKAELEKLPDDFGKQVSSCNEEIASQKSVDISREIQSDLGTSQDQPPSLDLKLNEKEESEKVPVFNTSEDFGKQVSSCNKEITSQESMDTSTELDSDLCKTPLVDAKVIENLQEQSREPGCMWSLKEFSYIQKKKEGLLSFNCELLESSTTIKFELKMPKEDSLDSCSGISNRKIFFNDDEKFRLPEYNLVIDFGFQKVKKYFDEEGKKVEIIRYIPYFLDQMNSFVSRINYYLRQVYSILTLYPGSRLKNSTLSFRLFSFPIFFSSTLSIDLTDLFRLSDSCLSFDTDFGNLDENKIKEIFRECLKCENGLCEFIVRSTKYLIDVERESGYVSKRKHIRLLPLELRS